AGAVGEARVERIGNDERRALVGRHARGRLVDLRARGEDQPPYPALPAGVDDIDDALDADVEHEIGGAVEGRGAVDEGEVVHLVDAAHGIIDGSRIADVGVDEFDVALDFAQPAQGPTGIIVEDPHCFALTHERLDQGRAEKAAAAGDQNAPCAHRLTFLPSAAARIPYRPRAGE